MRENAHRGTLIWAHKLDRPEPGCLLVNHWQQCVVKVTEYDPSRGAIGTALGHRPRGTPATGVIEWPAQTLEMEIAEKKWQAVAVSESFNDILPSLPQVRFFLFLLLLFSSYTPFFDLGLTWAHLPPHPLRKCHANKKWVPILNNPI